MHVTARDLDVCPQLYTPGYRSSGRYDDLFAGTRRWRMEDGTSMAFIGLLYMESRSGCMGTDVIPRKKNS